MVRIVEFTPKYTPPEPEVQAEVDSAVDSDSDLISLIYQLISCKNLWNSNSPFIPLIFQIISLLGSMDLDSEPESKLMSLITRAISVFNSMDLDSLPEPLLDVILLIFNSIDSEVDSKVDSKLRTSLVFQALNLKPEPELISLINQIFSLVAAMKVRVISLCPQAEITLKEGKFHAREGFSWITNDKSDCICSGWGKFSAIGHWKEDTHFLCLGCGGENHKECEEAPVEIKHSLHPKHSLQLVTFGEEKITRKCYCCDEDIREYFYYCWDCDFALFIGCVEKPPILSLDHPKWHHHTLALFPSQASLPCSLCALTNSSSCPFYLCPPCDFVAHRTCLSLPRVIRISRHLHRISFTASFDEGDWFCGVCRTKINNDYGGYSCIKDGCSYAAHSKCATQSNVWDGIELEGVPEEEMEEVAPFVTISDGIIQHFSHEHHHLTLVENMGIDYDEDKLCQICIMPIYFGKFYSCIQCDFILHEVCANFSRRIHNPIHPHMLTLMTKYDRDSQFPVPCSACPWLCTAGFLYVCGKEECEFNLHVQCATISEPLVHESHKHPLFLTSKPGEQRVCSVCKDSRPEFTGETFNCIECDFALCFGCGTLPQKVRYKHDKHILTLSYGEETNALTYWCEVCEGELNPKERYYSCDEYCCLTLHIECLIGKDLYMKPGSSWYHWTHKAKVLRYQHMSRPICSACEKRCSYKVFFQYYRVIFCSTSCFPFVGIKFARLDVPLHLDSEDD